ncbi:MAG TPA: DUF2935 domain-containing protein [Xanthomonadaceae bacterium]|nr:DUF2935 domain-containing protein [Xanthomonadaceae bacterium]
MESIATRTLDHVPAPVMSRRRVLVGGLALVGTSLLATAEAAGRYAGIVTKGGGTKPTYLAEAGSRDPAALSMAENLFWNEQMMEHAAFFVMLMPGPELARVRKQAEAFKETFAAQLAKSGNVDAGNYRAFNQSTIDQVKRYSEYEYRLRDEQAAGKLQSLVWPTFFDHTAREGDYFVDRLARLSQGEVSMDKARTAEFWTLIMGEHAGFIAHLLDPSEQALVAKAMKNNEAFLKMHAHPVPTGKAVRAVEDILDFKTAAQKGIETGKIKSIIDPALADHVRREAIKAADDLRRAA